MTHTDPTTYPHAGGCAECYAANVCNVCGDVIRYGARCTNGRCIWCHNDCCTPGGDVSPGHGFGDASKSRRLRVKRAPPGTLP